jgi:DNA-binding response OmpR family regulator
VFRRLRGDEELGDVPVVLAVEPDDVEDLGELVDVDELIVRPYQPAELQARIARARRSLNAIGTDDVVRVGTLEIDLATYVVTIDSQPVDFTYMEYQLLNVRRVRAKLGAEHAERLKTVRSVGYRWEA